ncbi:MAG: hypothetical protein MUD01_24595 [Chloroflexaceae bacterium]|jgi:predicted esterase|nr:hypothetical protein [Chloroflexaceae bacterium]
MAMPTMAAPQPGVHALGLFPRRDTLLYVPKNYTGQQPAPLAVMLHGAGGEAQHAIALLQPLADAAGLLLLAPASRGRTWDIIVSDYGPDVAQLDQGLAEVFSRFAIDSAHVAVGGFSDGASYGLSLGLMNGDLFSHILAFSPGFMAPIGQKGQPGVFISHGTHDTVLPIDRCSRRIVPQLKAAGYRVNYHEFDGPHTVPESIARQALAWFAE